MRPFACKREKRRIDRFSPILPISAVRVFSTVEFPNGSADSAATSAGLRVATSCARLRTKARKSSFFATKSVSQFTSTIEPSLPSALTSTATIPSAVTRAAARLALLPSLTRRISSALARSPCASVSAFLHSIIGASVFSRSSFTSAAVISAITCSIHFLHKKGACAPFLFNVGARSYGGRPTRSGRVFFFVDLDELSGRGVHDALQCLRLALEHGVRDTARVQAHRPARIVV